MDRKEISEDRGEYLHILNPKIPKFYILLKIYKNTMEPPGYE
jgi:hypothetical protein